MLKLMVIGSEFYNEENNEFITHDSFELLLEHSLLALSKWEARFEKPFLEAKDKTREETLYYIEAMILNEDYPEDILNFLTTENIKTVNAYIDSAYTATTFNNRGPKKPGRPQVITSELIYSWMVAYQIPFSCEEWHLNRLFALIRICNINNDPKKSKMSAQEAAAQRSALNAQRKKELGTTG